MLRHSTALRLTRLARYINARPRHFCTESTTDSVAEANRARVRDYLSRFGPPSDVTPSAPADTSAQRPGRPPLKKHIPVTKEGPTAAELSDLLHESGARDVTTVDVRNTAPFADWLVIATAHAGPHVHAVANELCLDLRKRGVRVGGNVVAVVDADSPDWQIVDVGPIVVHVLSEEARELYRLETLWSDEGDAPEDSHEDAPEVVLFDPTALQETGEPPQMEQPVVVEQRGLDAVNESMDAKATVAETPHARTP